MDWDNPWPMPSVWTLVKLETPEGTNVGVTCNTGNLSISLGADIQIDPRDSNSNVQELRGVLTLRF